METSSPLEPTFYHITFDQSLRGQRIVVKDDLVPTSIVLDEEYIYNVSIGFAFLFVPSNVFIDGTDSDISISGYALHIGLGGGLTINGKDSINIIPSENVIVRNINFEDGFCAGTHEYNNGDEICGSDCLEHQCSCDDHYFKYIGDSGGCAGGLANDGDGFCRPTCDDKLDCIIAFMDCTDSENPDKPWCNYSNDGFTYHNMLASFECKDGGDQNVCRIHQDTRALQIGQSLSNDPNDDNTICHPDCGSHDIVVDSCNFSNYGDELFNAESANYNITISNNHF